MRSGWWNEPFHSLILGGTKCRHTRVCDGTRLNVVGAFSSSGILGKLVVERRLQKETPDAFARSKGSDRTQDATTRLQAHTFQILADVET